MSNFTRKQQRSKLKVDFKKLKKANSNLKNITFSEYVEYVNNVKRMMVNAGPNVAEEVVKVEDDLSDIMEDIIEE